MSSSKTHPLKPARSSSSSPRSTARCCGRIRDDWSLAVFALQEPLGVVDVEASFAATGPSRPRWRVVALKLVLAAWTLSILLNDLLRTYESADARKFYLIYMTNWCALFTVLYTWLSLTISLFPKVLAQQQAGPLAVNDKDRPGLVVCFTWGLYSAIAVIQMAVALLFWLLEYDVGVGCPSYSSLMKHGGFMVFILLEGLVLNSIPVRAKHIIFSAAFALLYLTWTLLHALFSIGNPFREDNDPETDDDTIYGAISWRQRPQFSAQVAAATLFLVIPLLFLTLWTAALRLRRYVDANATTSTSTSTTFNDGRGAAASAYYKPMSA